VCADAPGPLADVRVPKNRHASDRDPRSGVPVCMCSVRRASADSNPTRRHQSAEFRYRKIRVVIRAELSGRAASVYFRRPASVGKGFQSSIATSPWLGWRDDKRFPRDSTRCMAA
jgi:hypothetical protein